MYKRSKVSRNLSSIGLFLILCLTISISQTNAAVVFDSSSSQGQFDTLGVTSVSWPHTVGTNPARALYVSVSTSTTVLPAFPGSRVTGVTYGGNALAPVGSRVSSDNRNSVEIYRLINPASGTATIQVNLVAGTANYAVGGGTSYSGVNQTTPNGTFTSAAANNASPAVVISDAAAGDLVLDTLAVSPTGGFFGEGAGQILRWNGRSFFGFAFDIGAGSTESSAASPVTMSWTLSGTDSWALAGFAVKSLPSTAAAAAIGGKIITEAGRPVSRTFVTLRNLETGEEFRQISNHFGFYRFENIETGSLYQIRAAHGRFEFSPDSLIFEINESVSNVDFVGQPKGQKSKKNSAERRRFR